MTDRRLGPFAVEYSGAEVSKFTAPLLLVHGLWDRFESWRLFSGFFSHRGWRCAALDVSGAGSLTALREGMVAAIESLEAPPVIVGHDLGGNLALEMAARARAVVALAPLGVAASPALRSAGSWLARRRGGGLRSPRGAWRGAYDAGLRAVESSRLVADVMVERATERVAVPALLMSGKSDPLVPVEMARAQAEIVGAELEAVEGGHLLHRDEAWEKRVAIVHRWLVRNLGADLLVLYEEAMAEREESGA